MKRLRHVWTDARGIETVQWVAWGGVLLILIAVVYGVFNGNAQLRAAIRSTTAFLAVRFGSDLGARGPRVTAPCLLDDPVTPQPCDPPLLATSPAVRAVVFDPPTVSAVVITPLGRTVIRPAAGVPAVVEPHTARIRLIDAPGQRMILIDPVRWDAVAIDLATGVATPLPVAALIAQGLIEVQPLGAPASAPLGLATLGVPRALPDHLALAATFASVAGLFGLASRGVPSGTLASAAAGARVPPWLAALGQVLLGVILGVLALVALAALIYVGAALLAAVGIGAGLSFLAALIIAGIVLAVGFVILEIRARWEEYAAQHGDPDFWTALQIVGVSLLSLSGIPQLIEAGRGARLVSDAPLSETERWVLGLGGLAQCVLFLLGVRVGLRSLGRLGWGRGRPGAPRVAGPDGSGAGAPPLRVPQGMTPEQFRSFASAVRKGAGHLGSDIRVHGSRAAGTARPDSDIGIAIRVSPERFNQLVRERFGTPNPGSAKERTMLHALETGKIQAGEAGLRGLRRSLEERFGYPVDISVIREGGPFDRGPWIPLPNE